MSFFSYKLRVLLALGATAGAVSAQQTLIVSKPADVDSDKANSFMDTTRRLHAGDYKAPHQLLNLEPDLPMPQPTYQGNWNPQTSDEANKRKYWTLLTPEQILGVQTPAEILGVKSLTDKKNLSLEEQFLLRQQQSPRGIATNGGAGALLLRDDSNPFLNNDRNSRQSAYAGSSDSRQYDPAQSDSYRSLKRLFDNANAGNAGNISVGNGQQPDSIWTSGFTQPSQPKIDQSQLEAMERFRSLMTPSPAPEKVTMPSSYSPSRPDTHSPSSFFDPQPNVNPVGRSYSTLESDITRPKGLTPLPGVTGPMDKKPDTKRPSWKAQLPPWMSEGPQSYNPNR